MSETHIKELKDFEVIFDFFNLFFTQFLNDMSLRKNQLKPD